MAHIKDAQKRGTEVKTITMIYQGKKLIMVDGLTLQEEHELHLLLCGSCGDNDCPCFRSGFAAARGGG